MAILVAGAGGFIGGHLIAELRRRGEKSIRAVDIKPFDRWYQTFDDVENLQFDLRDPNHCQAVCKDIYDVYNLACDMGGMGFIETHKAACMISVLINTNLLIAARDQMVKRFFYSSSACVYAGNKQVKGLDNYALKEEDAYPAMPEDGYGWEKLFSERMCRHFREDFGLHTVVARFHNSYGPMGTWNGGREKAPAAICRKVIEAKHSGNHSIDIWGDGSQLRSFMWVDDNVHGILRLMDLEYDQPINLGSAEMVSVNELVDTVEDYAGIKLEREYLLDKPKGVAGRSSDNSLLRSVTGWEPGTSLKEGIAKTYDWIEQQYLASQAIVSSGSAKG